MTSNVSLLRRLGAIAYDIFLVFSLVFFVIGLMLIVFFEQNTQNNMFIFALSSITVYFYFAWSWVKGGQTLGMKAWKFRVMQNNGNNITHQQALIRFILAIVSFATMGFGFIYQLFNQHNLTLHDQYSNTCLIRLIKS